MTSKNSREWQKMIYRKFDVNLSSNHLIFRSRASETTGTKPVVENDSNGLKSSETNETDDSTIEGSDSQNELDEEELNAKKDETEKQLEEGDNEMNDNANPGIIKAKLIRTEGPLADLPVGTFFFTLYADDFIESSMKALQKQTTDVKQEKIYRIVNERFHMLTVSSLSL